MTSPRPANAAERDEVLCLLERQPIEGQLVIADKGFAGAKLEEAVAALGANLLLLSRTDEPQRPSTPIGRVRQRIESIMQSLNDQVRLEKVVHLAVARGRKVLMNGLRLKPLPAHAQVIGCFCGKVLPHARHFPGELLSKFLRLHV